MKIMKFVKNSIVALILLCMGFVLVGCGEPQVNIALGVYDENAATFTENTSMASYTLEQSGNTLILKGTVPYSESALGINAGNIIAIKFTPTATLTPDDTTSIKTTNSQDPEANGWNVYDQSALEADGSLIWVTAVSKTADVQIKIKWNTNYDEVTYTLSVDESATLATS